MVKAGRTGPEFIRIWCHGTVLTFWSGTRTELRADSARSCIHAPRELYTCFASVIFRASRGVIYPAAPDVKRYSKINDRAYSVTGITLYAQVVLVRRSRTSRVPRQRHISNTAKRYISSARQRTYRRIAAESAAVPPDSAAIHLTVPLLLSRRTSRERETLLR